MPETPDVDGVTGKAVADRDARPWLYYELDRDVLIRMLNEQADILAAHHAALGPMPADWLRGVAADITLHVRRGAWDTTEVQQAITHSLRDLEAHVVAGIGALEQWKANSRENKLIAEGLIRERDALLAAGKAFADHAIETADGNIVFGSQALDRLRAAIAKTEAR